VADPQPWRSPRPAPDLADLRAHPPVPGPLAWLSAWWPAMAWAGVIFWLSTNMFSAKHTASVVAAVLRWFWPGVSEDRFHAIHYYIRKSAHFSEYFVFCLLIYRGVRGKRAGWRWTWALEALFFAAAYSALDEVHQAFVASRVASVYDALLDSRGRFRRLRLPVAVVPVVSTYAISRHGFS